MTDAVTIFQGLKNKAPQLALTTAKERASKIQGLIDATLAAREEIFAAAHEELGLCKTDVIGQLMIVKVEGESVIRNLSGWMTPTHVKNAMMTMGKTCYVHYEPKGVILHLATWNAPIAIGLMPAIGMIAAGNAVLLKPSELAPRSAAIVEKIVRSAMPADEFAVMQGGAEVAQELLRLPFDHICYVTLEMGGKSPVVVDATANVEDAAKKIAWGRLSNAGQVCVAPDYAIVHASIRDKFVADYARAAAAMFGARGGFENSEEYPRIINQTHFARITGLIDDAVAKGATIAFGGQSDAAGRFIAPTVLTDVTEDMEVMKSEIFGPILPVTTYKAKEDAIAIIRRRPKPLALYVYSRDSSMREYLLRHTSSGSTVFNHNMIQSGTNPNLPFGGANHSGMGRLGGHAGFLEFSNARSVIEEHPDAGDIMMSYPPYDQMQKKTMAGLLGRSTIVPGPIMAGIETALKLRLAFKGRRQSTS
jgi:aldehyde dehydrogenase (NAD+)